LQIEGKIKNILTKRRQNILVLRRLQKEKVKFLFCGNKFQTVAEKISRQNYIPF